MGKFGEKCLMLIFIFVLGRITIGPCPLTIMTETIFGNQNMTRTGKNCQNIVAL